MQIQVVPSEAIPQLIRKKESKREKKKKRDGREGGRERGREKEERAGTPCSYCRRREKPICC